MTARTKLHALLGLVAATVLLPLAILLLGLWEGRRAEGDWAAFAGEGQRISAIVADLEARTPRDGRIDFTMQFRRNGQLYGGPLALDKARAAQGEVATLTMLMDWRRHLPPVVVAGGGLAAALSILILLAGSVLERAGRTSRDALVRGFSLVRLLLPGALALQILAAATAAVAAMVFEAGLLVQSGLGGDAMKLLGVAAVAIGAIVIAAGSTLLGLWRARAAFEPDPLPVFGRPVSAAEAPGLWRLTEGLADRLGALKPEAVVVGLTGGFFVSAGPAVLEPGGERTSGRILYLPLPYLAVMRGDEVAAILGHELAHFAGGDTAYSQRFLPIYAGVGRSLEAVAAGHQGALGLLGPSLCLGLFVMERFPLSVRHWSRAREFAADAAGAGLTSPEAAARALLRTGAVQPRIVEALDAAVEAPDSAPADLVAAVLDRAVARGLDDPAAHLEAEQAHPTDTHPPTRERVAALGLSLGPDLLALAAAAPPQHALGQLGAYFADPAELSRAATADFLGAVRDHEAAVRAHLEETAAGDAGGDLMLRDNSRPGAFVLIGAAVLFGLVALGFWLVPVPGLDGRAVTVVAVALGAVLAGLGAYRLWRGERTTLVLKPEGLAVPGLDRTIAWGDVADLDMTVNRTGLVTRLLLAAEAVVPGRVPGGRGLKVDAKRRIVTVALGLPRRMKPQDFADAVGRYQAASEARRILGAQGAGSEARMASVAPAASPNPTEALPARLPSVAQGWANAFWVLFGVAALGGILVACTLYTAPAVVSDWQVRETARAVPGARVSDGKCSAKLILHICDATLILPAPSGVTRRVNYVFSGLHVGDHRIGIMADPARPDLVTTDLGLEQLWNRTITLLVIALLIVACIVGAVASLLGNWRAASGAPG